MNQAHALRRFRSLTIELTALEQQLRACGQTGRPRGVMTQRYDTLRGTNDPAAAALQLAEGLEAMAQRKREELALLRPQVEAALSQVSDFRLLVVLRRYYLAGETDEQAAEAVHLSDRYVCRMRNAFLRSLDSTPSAQ
ncbi:MAG: hypothetical protein ACI4MJ_07030 [Aristaeellaceae bacterium]